MELNHQFVLEILKGVDIFAELDYASLSVLGTLFKEQIFNQKETIFEEGAMGNSMMIIASGDVRVSQRTETEKEEALIVLKKGDVFGEMALLEDQPRSATTIAHTNVICLEISRDDFLNFITTDPISGVRILLKLCKTLSSRLRDTDVKLKTFVSLTQWI